MSIDSELLDEATASQWYAYISTADGDTFQSGRLTASRSGGAFLDDGSPVTLVDATRTASGAIIGRTANGHEVVIRPTARTAS